jgi:hypothetical protein
LWRICKIAVEALRSAVLGPVDLHTVLRAAARWHKLVADPKRRRRRQILYPVPALS